jgi:DNA (cytosine-5)-methyltransferase 1
MSQQQKRPLAVDLFAGAGGMTLGFEQAGFDVVAAVEIDPIHCAVHEFNFPQSTIIPRTAAGLTAANIRKLAGIGRRKVDCVFGGPPCQGFSLIGHRTLDDPRNSLVLQFVRLVAELDATTFVFENVKGLTVGRHRAFLEELVTTFDAAGYDVRLPWQVLDAAHYGVPQHRERLILIGTKKGAPLATYPSQQTNARTERRQKLLPMLPFGPNCGDALSDVPNAERFPALLDSDTLDAAKYGKPSTYAAELRCITNDAWHYGYPRKWNASKLTSSARTTHTDISKRRFTETKPGDVEAISRFFKLSAEGLSNTLRAGTDGSRGAFTSPRPIHYEFARCITVREMARLHGFPDWFRLHTTKWHGARQIGNAVPPPLARAVAKMVMLSLGATPIRPATTLDLGDPKLLNFDMSSAAAHFKVNALNGRRDRKSGATKRKQHEIESEQQRLRVNNG